MQYEDNMTVCLEDGELCNLIFLGESLAQQEGLELLSASSDSVFARCPLGQCITSSAKFPFHWI